MPQAGGPLADLVPGSLVEAVTGRAADGGPDGDAWLRALPALVGDALARWDLTVDAGSPVRHGECAIVVPVVRGGRGPGEPAVLKMTWPHPEAAQEHLALRAWSGRRAVRLLAADPASWSLLLEPLMGDRDLTGEPIETACAVIGGLLADLAIPAPGWAPPLSRQVAALRDRLAGAGGVPLPRRFVDQARSLTQDFLGEPGIDATLLHTDLHYENVLAGPGPGEWTAIDPKPLAADPAYGVWPALHNRWDELGTELGEIRWAVHCRLGWVCDAAGLDEDRARSWGIVRTVADALWLHSLDPAVDLTRAVTLLKALQPW